MGCCCSETSKEAITIKDGKVVSLKNLQKRDSWKPEFQKSFKPMILADLRKVEASISKVAKEIDDILLAYNRYGD